MNIIKVEKGLAMYLAQNTGYIEDIPVFGKQISFLSEFLITQGEIKREFNVSFQMFNSKFIISEDQLKFILHHVHSAFSLGSNISKHFGVEFLVYLSNERQITKAIEKVGISISYLLKDFSAGEILFGEPDDLKQAINFLENKFSRFKRSQFKYLEPNEWETFMETYEISIDQITNILRGNNTPIKGKINSLDDLKDFVSLNSIRKAITDAYNTRMVKLFLENFKKNKGIIEK